MWHGQLATPGSFWTGSWCFLLSLSCCSCSSRAPCPRSTLLCLLAPTFLSIPPWGFSCHPQRKMIMAGPPLPSQDLLHRESGFTCDLWSWCAHSWLPSTEELIFMPHWVPLISHLLGEMTQQVKVLAGKSGLFYPQNPHSGRKEQTHKLSSDLCMCMHILKNTCIHKCKNNNCRSNYCSRALPSYRNFPHAFCRRGHFSTQLLTGGAAAPSIFDPDICQQKLSPHAVSFSFTLVFWLSAFCPHYAKVL